MRKRKTESEGWDWIGDVFEFLIMIVAALFSLGD